MRLRRSLPFLSVFVCIGFAGLACFASGPARKPGGRKLVVISIAGLDARFLNQPGLQVKAPNIRKLMRQGMSAAGVVGVAPSDNGPSGISMVTGLPPAEASGATPPVWVAASKMGLKTGVIYWPENVRTELAFDFPPPEDPPASHDVPFDGVAAKASPPGLADRIDKYSPGFEKQLWDDSSAASAALYLLRTADPDLLLVQFTELDAEQRETGALSVYARDTLENDDDLIGQILAAIPPGTVVAIVSGHGFENQNYVVRPRVLLKESQMEVEDGLIGTSDGATAARLRRLLTDGHRHGIAREVPMAEVKAKAPSLARWIAAFDTAPNYAASADDHGPAVGPGTHLGISGLWPTRPGYRSVFVMSGEGIPARRLGEIDLLQIAPTLADVIGVELPEAKGKSLLAGISH